MEYARNVLGIVDAEHEESSPGAPTLVIQANPECIPEL
jgi:CTP synthase (UTP-ammonia lyase)